jgi:hypothetical protein
MIKTISALFLLAATAVVPSHASVVYQFTVDTTSLASTAANLDFLLLPGGASPAAVSVAISGFTTDGAFNPAVIALTGDAAGALDTGLILGNTTGFNDGFQPITLGNAVSFLATFSGAGVDTPGTTGTTFSFSIYDAAGTTALLTTAADGSIAGVNIDALSGIVPYTNGPATVGPPPAVPEPGSLSLIGLGLLAMAGTRRLFTSGRP